MHFDSQGKWWEKIFIHTLGTQCRWDILARYADLEIWRLASTNVYLSVPETGDLPWFDNYPLFERRWTNELAQIPRMAGDDCDGRFYYSDMAQAYLLDRVLPDWKVNAFDVNI